MKEVIGCYKIHLDKKLSLGRQEFLYECINTDTKLLCCARVLSKKDQSGNTNSYSLDKERKVLQQLKWLRHDNLLTIYDYKEEDDYIYQFCELYDQTLVEYMKPEVSLTKLQFLDIISQISSGYMELKKLNIIHRDLKPENILIKKYHNQIKFKIADFRISKKINDQEGLNTKIVRTQKYSSPEIQYQDLNYSYESDIFSFGLILYEMAVGNVDIIENQKQNDFFEALKQHGFKKYIREFQTQNDLQEEILDILDNLIVYNPSMRMTWENLNWLADNKLREYNSYLLPISGRGKVNLYPNNTILNLSNSAQLVENRSFPNLDPLEIQSHKFNNQFQNQRGFENQLDNNQFFNNEKAQQNFKRQHLRTESDQNFNTNQFNTPKYNIGKCQISGQNQQKVIFQNNQNLFSQNLALQQNKKESRISFNTVK